MIAIAISKYDDRAIAQFWLKEDFLVNSQLDTGNKIIQNTETMSKAIQDVTSFLLVVLSDKNLAR